ncbi:MAG: hypothetical protein ACPGVU_14400 [Limisphaerales bacterium]
MRTTPFILLTLVLLLGCNTPKPSTTEVVVEFVNADRELIRDVKVVWNRNRGSQKIDADGPFTTNKKGRVILPRAVTKSDHRDRYEIRFQHPSYHPGSAWFSTAGMLTVAHDDNERTVEQRPFLQGNHIIRLRSRSD